MRVERAQAGFVLQVALGAIVILVVIGSFLYVRTEEHLQTTVAVRLQAIASSRATRAAEQAVAQLKLASPLGLSTLAPCPLSQSLGACSALAFATLDNGSGDLATGGGLQYQVNLIVRTNDAGLQPRLLVVSNGFYGYSGSPNLISAQVQVELSMPSSGLGTFSTGYAGGS
jgi:hypothetical protein